MADFKGRKKGEVPLPKHGDFFFGGSGHDPESLCQISAYYKFFPGKSYFYRTSRLVGGVFCLILLVFKGPKLRNSISGYFRG